MIKKILTDGVSYSYIETNRFKTSLISVGFYLPLSTDNAANSLCLSLMRSGTREFPDLYSFNRKLASLYGASISSWTAKNGDRLEMRLNLTVNSDRFSLNGEKLVLKAGKLLCDMVFGRYEDGSDYTEEVFCREKRLLCEKISSALNEKRTYARAQCEELMCETEPYGFAVDGTLEDAEKLTQDDVKKAVARLIETSFISVIVISDSEPAEFADEFTKRILSVKRSYSALPQNTVRAAGDTCREKNEKMPVAQGKLVIGFRTNTAIGNDRETVPTLVMTDIFGGGPHGKLFCNVREKLSLCYYCAARATRSKGIILVDSGVEENNMKAAEAAILEQFGDMQNGNFTDSEFEASKRSLIDMIRSAESDQPTLLHWYAARALDENGMTTADACEAIDKVTKEDVITAAKAFGPDTVYRLLPEKEEE